MKPVFQTTDAQGRGDCFSACLATIFELPLSEIPNFRLMSTETGTPMDALYNRWLSDRGWSYIRTYTNHAYDFFGAMNVPCVLCVPSQVNPGGQHAVVARIEERSPGFRRVIVHDPNPRNKPYPDDVEVLWTGFYVPMRPSMVPRDDVRKLLSDWMEFAKDVAAGCAAGQEWLDSLRARTDATLR